MAILGAAGGNAKLQSVIVMVAMVRLAISGGDGATSTSHFVENSCGH
jgi:hypothetical protein